MSDPRIGLPVTVREGSPSEPDGTDGRSIDLLAYRSQALVRAIARARIHLSLAATYKSLTDKVNTPKNR
jgi:hypothetical protein